jgi:GNAT superfamily N-acetyltransferase
MHIHDAHPEDTEALAAFMRHVVTTSVKLGADEIMGVLENVQRNLLWAQQHSDSAVHLKYVIDARIVGVVLVKNHWNLCSLFVDPGVQRQGVGSSLLNAAIQRCIPRNDRGHMAVNAAPNAVQFYQALGFTIVDGHPRKGVSLPMRLRLAE